MMNGQGKSDSPIVPENSPNKGGRGKPSCPVPSAEGREGRGLAKGNSPEQTTPRTQGRVRVQQALGRVRRAAQKDKGLWFIYHPYPLRRMGVIT